MEAKHNKFLEQADRTIARLKDKLLPYSPHLLIVQEQSARLWNPSELRGTPFEEHEVKHLQYMTMVTHGDRGIVRPRGDWQDMIDSRSPSAAARSTATTPNPAKDPKIPKNKFSLAEYARMKKDGVKPSPRPTSAEESKAGHSRNTSQVSSEPMSRGPSLESIEDRHMGRAVEKIQTNSRPNGANAPTNLNSASQAHAKGIDGRSTAGPTRHADTNTKPTTNGTPKSLHSQSTNQTRPQQISKTIQPIKHALPPRPPSPIGRNGEVKRNTDHKQQKRIVELSESTQNDKRPKIGNPPAPHKRPLDPSESTHSTEKRAKADHVRTPSGSQKSLHKSEAASQVKTSPSQARTPQASSLTRKEPPKPINTKSSQSSQKPVDLPPLLSPLPADLDNSPESPPRHDHGKKAANKTNSSHSTPSKSNVGSDTIVVKDIAKKSHLSNIALDTPPKSSSSGGSSPPFILPPLLSPGLPPVVEKELERLQEKAKYESLKNRNERVRRADAPGVARKMPKIGHPPKRRPAESSGAESSDHKGESSKVEIRPNSSSGGKFMSEGGAILRLKYKKTRSKDIQRILGIRPRPSSEFRQMEEKRVASEKVEEKRKIKADDSEDDTQQLKVAQSSSIVSKKRTSESFEPTPEPAPKRLKPSNLDVAKSKAPLEPAFKSPTLSAPVKKDLLSTPKKSDTLKSTAMRKVPSTDSHAHTPQATSSSTPASAEKPRSNGEPSKRPVDASKYLGENGEGRLAKREMDRLLKPYMAKVPESAEPDLMMGLCRGLECLVAYNTGFSIGGHQKPPKHKAGDWESAVRLWDFVLRHSGNFPVLYHLCWQIGALFKEELARTYTAMLGELKDLEVAKGLIEKMAQNAKSKDKCWTNAQIFRRAALELGVKREMLGPWSTEKDARDYIVNVLEAFSKKENLGWKKMFDD